MAFRVPNPATITDPAERVRWQALERFLQSPVFENGVSLGDGTGATNDGLAGTTVPAATTKVDSANLSDAATPDDGAAPAAPSGVSVTASVRALLVRWDANTETDMGQGWGSYKVEWDTDSSFGSPLSVSTGATAASIGGLDTGSTVFVRVAAVDATGLVSPWSGTVSGVPVQVETADIAVGAIDVERLADFVVTARKMGDLAHHIY